MEKKQMNFIEKYGLFFEKNTSFPRIAGKIFAYLLVCDPSEQTQEEIAKKLGIAKGSASTMIRMLLQTEIIEELTKPGVRSKFYRIRNGGWENLFFAKLKKLSDVRVLLNEGKSILKERSAKNRKRVNDIDLLYEFFETEMSSIVSRWNAFNKKRGNNYGKKI